MKDIFTGENVDGVSHLCTTKLRIHEAILSF